MIGLITKIIDVYEVNSDTTSRKRALLLGKVSFICGIILIGGICMYVSSGMLLFINPFYAYYWHNELKVTIPMYLPFIDETTETGFFSLLTIHFIEIVCAAVGTGCADFAFLVIVANIPVFTTIFVDNVNELNEILQEKKIDWLPAKAKLLNVFLLYNEIWQ